VDSWTDQQGGITLNSGAVKPVQASETFGNGSHTVIQFSGAVNNFLQSSSPVAFSSLVGDTQGAIFIVYRQNGVASGMAGSTPVGWGGGSDRLFAQTDYSGTGLHFQFGNPVAGGDLNIANNSSVIDNQWHILSLVRNGTAGTVHLDGAVLGESGSAFLNSSAVSGSSSLLIGGSGDNTDNFTGAIAEVLTYNLGSVDSAAVENYLGEKYGLAPVPEPSQYAMLFGLACIAGALVVRYRKQPLTA
jgi:hypothetical protein